MLRVQVNGRRRDIGLGSSSDLTLAEAREKAAALRKVARSGRDPIEERDIEKNKKVIPTFKEAAVACHKAQKQGWSEKYADAWIQTLETHAYPSLGKMRVDGIEASQIRDALLPIWHSTPVMARKVRQRIGMVLNYSKGEDWRATEAPVKSLSVLMAKQEPGGNFEAMPYADVPAFVAAVLAKPETMGRLALLFTIVTAARSGETRKSKFSFVDRGRAVWNRPANIMKLRKPHTVTLSDYAMTIIEKADQHRTTKADCLIFPGKGGAPLSDMTLTKVLRDAGLPFTVHGFRSSFRDWAAERMPTIPDAVAEAALAHKVPDAVIAAYKRTTFMDMRRQLLDAWGRYVMGVSNVVALAVA